MIESIENAFQITALLFCAAVALRRAILSQSKAWTLLFFFYGTWLLGDIYWLIYLVFFGETPQISMVSDLSWYSAFIFLYLLLLEVAPMEKQKSMRLIPWLGPAFTLSMALFYILQWGKIVSNLIYASLMGSILFSAINRLTRTERYAKQNSICIAILFLCLMEHGLWTASCFFWDDSLRNPYYWFDFFISVSFVLFLPATKKAVEV